MSWKKAAWNVGVKETGVVGDEGRGEKSSQHENTGHRVRPRMLSFVRTYYFGASDWMLTVAYLSGLVGR